MSYNEIESMTARQIASTTEQLVAKGISTLVADSLEDILQCADEKAHTGGRSVVYNVVEKMFFDLSRGK